MEREDYFFGVKEEVQTDKLLVLIIYDIIDNAKRVRFAKMLQGYGVRVQKSAFEAKITKKKYEKLLKQIPAYIGSDDNVRVYRIQGKGQITAWGKSQECEQEDIILI